MHIVYKSKCSRQKYDLGSQETHQKSRPQRNPTRKLGTTLTEAKSNYESILLVRDDIKAELCEIQRKKLEWKLDETLEIENLEDEDQDDETMLLEAAEDAEVENRLQEFKRKT